VTLGASQSVRAGPVEWRRPDVLRLGPTSTIRGRRADLQGGRGIHNAYQIILLGLRTSRDPLSGTVLSPQASDDPPDARRPVMTSWGFVILAAAVFLGLKRSMTTRRRYTTAFVIVLVAVGYAALHQHTY
jgi:hypothetical protein